MSGCGRQTRGGDTETPSVARSVHRRCLLTRPPSLSRVYDRHKCAGDGATLLSAGRYSNSRPTCGTVSPTQVISAAHARPKQRLTRCQSLKCETLCAANLTHAAIPAAKLGLRPRWLLRCPSHPTLHPQIQVHWLPLFSQRCQRQKGLVLSILTRRLQHLHAGERDRAGGHLPFPWLPRTAAR